MMTKFYIKLFFLLFCCIFGYSQNYGNYFSFDFNSRIYEDNTQLYQLSIEDTFTYRTNHGAVLLAKGSFSSFFPAYRAGIGAGLVFTHLPKMYSELHYLYFHESDGKGMHKLYADITYENFWGFVNTSVNTLISDKRVITASIGKLLQANPSLFFWNRYSFSIDELSSINHGLWTELRFSLFTKNTWILGTSMNLDNDRLVQKNFPDILQLSPSLIIGFSDIKLGSFALMYRFAIQWEEFNTQYRHSLGLSIQF